MTDRRQYPRPFAAILAFAIPGIAAASLLCSCRAVRPVAAGSPPARRMARPAGAQLSAALPAPPGQEAGPRPAEARTAPAADPRAPVQPPPRSAVAAKPLAVAFAPDSPLALRLRGVVEDALARGVTRHVGVAVYDLATNQGADLHGADLFRPASVIKLAVLVGAYRARSRMTAAQFNRLRPDLERMITVSDNAATRRLVKRLGAASINAAIRDLGFRRFCVGESGAQEWVLQGSKADAEDTALLLARIARRQVVSREASNEMLALLGAQQLRGRIPAGLPPAPDLWVGNKTGTLNGVVNDAGIVLQPDRGIAYTLAIFTSGTRSEAAGTQLLADLSAVVYGYMARQHRG